MNKIRSVESSVLDVNHKLQPLLQRSQHKAIAHLLKLYGDIHRDMSSEARSGRELGSATRMHLVLLGLEHSLRWVLKECPIAGSNDPDDWEQLDKEALSLLVWGIEYSQLAAVHTAWSRGAMGADINELEKKIVFSVRGSIDPSLLISQAYSESMLENNQRNAPLGLIAAKFKTWATSIDVRERAALRFDTPEMPDDVARSLLGWARHTIFTGLSDDENLDGFTLGEFRRFYAALFFLSSHFSMLESRTDHVYGLVNDLGSTVMQGQASEIIDFISNYAGISSRVVRHITSALTFDFNSFRSSLVGQPFVKSKCGRLNMSSRMFSIVDPYRMLAGALNRGSRRKSYERIVEKAERYEVGCIAARFGRLGFTVIAQRSIGLPDGQKICPDIVIGDLATSRVMIVEYKHALTPSNAAEVSNKIEEYGKWVRQVRRYKDSLALHSDSICASLGMSIKPVSVDAVLLLRWPLLIPADPSPDVIVCDMASFDRVFETKSGSSLSDMVAGLRGAWARSLKAAGAWMFVDVPIVVGDWTYVHPVVADVGGDSTAAADVIQSIALQRAAADRENAPTGWR